MTKNFIKATREISAAATAVKVGLKAKCQIDESQLFQEVGKIKNTVSNFVLKSNESEVEHAIFLLESRFESYNFGGLRSIGFKYGTSEAYKPIVAEIAELVKALSASPEAVAARKANSEATNAEVEATSEATDAEVEATSEATDAEVEATSEATNAEVEVASEATNAEVEAASEATNAEVEANTDRNESILALINFAIEALEGLRGIFQP